MSGRASDERNCANAILNYSATNNETSSASFFGTCSSASRLKQNAEPRILLRRCWEPNTLDFGSEMCDCSSALSPPLMPISA